MSTENIDIEELRRSDRLRNQGPDPPMVNESNNTNDANAPLTVTTNIYENDSSNVHEIMEDEAAIPHHFTDNTNTTVG